jgi:hypothetical protein
MYIIAIKNPKIILKIIFKIIYNNNENIINIIEIDLVSVLLLIGIL